MVGRAVVFALLVLAAPAAGAPWLQQGYDAARTGTSPEPGPERLDVAFTLPIQGRAEDWDETNLVVMNGTAFFLRRALNPPSEPGTTALMQLDLDTAELETLVDLGQQELRISGIGSDGERLFYVAGNAVHALDPWTGAPAWPTPRSLSIAGDIDGTGMNCAAPAVLDGTVYYGCSEMLPTAYGAFAKARRFVVALDAASGERAWSWDRPVAEAEPLQNSPLHVHAEDPDDGVFAVAATGDRVYAVTMEHSLPHYHTCFENVNDAQARGSAYEPVIWALDPSSGALAWTWTEPPGAYTPGPDDGELTTFSLPGIAAREDGLYVKGASLYVVDPRTGCERTRVTFPAEALDSRELDGLTNEYMTKHHALALHGTRALVTHGRSIHLVDTADRSILWTKPDLYPADPWRRQVAIAGDVAYVLVERMLLAFSLSDGTILDDHVFDEEPVGIALADGAIAAMPFMGEATVLGTTAASIRLAVPPLESYPEVGSMVQVDLSGTTPGILDPSTSYRVDWGDSSYDDWQTDPVFTHVYDEPGERVVVIEAGNAGGQTASRALHWNVGGAPQGLAAATTSEPRLSSNALVAGGSALLALLGIGALALIVVRARARTASADRLAVYEKAIAREVHRGTPPSELVANLDAARLVLGISEREHARLEAAVRMRLSVITGGERHLVPGERFLDRYEVRRMLAAGGGGRTYLCRDLRLERDIVLKVLRSQGSEDDRERLLREARAFAAMGHERVLTLHDVEEVGDEVFLVLEHVTNGSLKDLLARGPLDAAAMLRLSDDLLAALGAVHAAGIVHRDVKPANVLVTREGRFKLADFGIAHLPGYEATIAGLGPGDAVGTVRYMSPEQARGDPVDARSDLYSAALTLYEGWTGVPTFAPREGESVVDVQLRAATGVGSLDGIAREPLRAFFERALAVDPTERFASAERMRVALMDALRGAEAPRGARVPGARPTGDP